MNRDDFFLNDPENYKDPWFKYAFDKAKEGNRWAQYEIGGFYEHISEHKKSFHWAEKSAVQGLMEGQFILGRIYLFGNDFIPIDRNKAFKYLSLAAEQRGHSVASYLAGKLAYFYFGQYKTGIKWLNQSIRLGCVEARSVLNDIKRNEGSMKYFIKKYIG